MRTDSNFLNVWNKFIFIISVFPQNLKICNPLFESIMFCIFFISIRYKPQQSKVSQGIVSSQLSILNSQSSTNSKVLAYSFKFSFISKSCVSITSKKLFSTKVECLFVHPFFKLSCFVVPINKLYFQIHYRLIVHL